jgi:protein-tyrosine phosphatase
LSLYWIDASPFRLAIAARPRGGDWLGNELQRLQNSGLQILVSMLTHGEADELGLTNEHGECVAYGLEYLNFPIEDRAIPENVLEFKRFVNQVVAQLKDGKVVAIHCRAGIGRSSLLACSVLVQLGITPSQAWPLIQKARGCAVPDTEEQKRFVEVLVEY